MLNLTFCQISHEHSHHTLQTGLNNEQITKGKAVNAPIVSSIKISDEILCMLACVLAKCAQVQLPHGMQTVNPHVHVWWQWVCTDTSLC